MPGFGWHAWPPSAVTTMRSIRAVPMCWTTGDVSWPLHRVSRSPCWYRMWCAGCPARRLRIARSRASIAAPGCGTACACICGIRSQRSAPGACSSPWTVAWRVACLHVWPSMPWGLGPSSRYMSSMMGHPMAPLRSSMPCAPALRGRWPRVFTFAWSSASPPIFARCWMAMSPATPASPSQPHRRASTP
ncbi:Uncharacterised protein [Collinsella intestinalis]|nr:Uncharacterised protein [Collinsella intestinalis]